MPKRVTEQQILDATADELLEKGYTSATTRNIALRAEISEVTLFRRYGSKAKLTAAAVTYVLSQEAWDFEVSGDVASDLLSAVTFHTKRSAEKRARLLPMMLLEIPRHPELRGALEFPLSQVSRIGAVIGEYQRKGVLRQEHPLHAVAGLLGPLIIVRMLQDASPEMPLPSIDLKFHVQSFLKGRLA